jgi:DNA-binding MarR family transcriptional regulator
MRNEIMKQDPLPRRPARERNARSELSAKPKPANDDIDFGPLANWVGFHLRLAQTASFQGFVREARSVELSPGRFATLMLIGRNPGISQTALAAANGRDKSTLTPILEDLDRRGLILRERLQTDRRSYQLTLTEAGRAMLDQLTECAARHDENLDRIIGPRERDRFLRTLQKISAALNGDL